MYPTKLERREGGLLVIEWSDHVVLQYTAADLRNQCPCATCREQRSQPQPALPVISAEEAQPVSIAKMEPVGNYAYEITFNDGHNTGIYTFEFLRELGKASN